MSVVEEPIFSEREARAFAPPERIGSWGWIVKHAVIPENKPHAGRYDVSKAPFMKGIIECLDDPEIEEIDVKKSAQGGISTAIIYAIGYITQNLRHSVAFVYPSKNKCKEALRGKA